MPRVRASVLLPYALKLQSGLYPTDRPGCALELVELAPLPGTLRRTTVSLTSEQRDTEDPEKQERLNSEQADVLLTLTNRLLRSYRAVTKDSTITELSRAAASPFRFRIDSEKTDLPQWASQLKYLPDTPRKLGQRAVTITKRVREMVASGMEPDVADLFLFDAERALHQARFREAVLFCWSTIDSTFSRKYDELVDARLAGEWAEARDFFKGMDFGLKKKMSAALYLMSGRSLFREPEDLWQQLSVSYNKRNAIIHRGENATEDDARRALGVARRVVEIMSTL